MENNLFRFPVEAVDAQINELNQICRRITELHKSLK